MRILFMLTMLLILTGGGISALQAADLPVSHKLGTDVIFQPRQILVTHDEVLVLDDADSFIKIFHRETKKFKTKIGGTGEGPGQCSQLMGMAVHDGKIYALDDMRRKIHFFSLTDKTYLTTRKYVSERRYTQPYEFVLTDKGLIYYSAGSLYGGNHLIAHMNADLQTVGGFLDSYPAYKNKNDFRKNSKRKLSYINLGYVAYANNKIYYTYWLLNKVLEFSLEGKKLNEYTLPLPSIDKTFKVVKYKNTNMTTIDHRLNYDLIGRKGVVYILSRHEGGFSIIYRLQEGKITELCGMKNKLFSIEVTDHYIYGADEDEGEVVVFKRQ